MFAKIAAALKMAFQGSPPTQPISDWQEDPEKWAEVDFHPIDTATAAAGGAEKLVCPVTRQELGAHNRTFRCRICQTTYSEEGWKFLRDVDRGKCCACGSQKSVDPV